MTTTSAEADEQRKGIALEYLKRLDRGEDFFGLFDDHAQLYFPKWGLANGIDEIKALFAGVGSILKGIRHDYAYFNYVFAGDTVVVEGTSAGTTADGTQWRAGVTHAGRWCDVFEIREGRIQRLYIYSTRTTAMPTPPAIPGCARPIPNRGARGLMEN